VLFEMRPTILLTGGNGQIGVELQRLLQQIGGVVAPSRGELDLLDLEGVRRKVRTLRPQLIVNAAAYTAVDEAETSQSKAYTVNAQAPTVLAEEAKHLGALLVHYSTDYVFDGSKRTPYVELDPANPINIYGRTKLAGEQAIRDSGALHLIFRTAWVYATRGRNFLLTILRLATEREELKIVNDQVGAPTYAGQIAVTTAKILADLYEKSADAAHFSDSCGTYHMTAAGETTWYDFAKAILEEAARTPAEDSWFAQVTKGRPMSARRILPISTEEFRGPAKRPRYSVLSNSLLKQTFGVAMPDWRSQLSECFSSRPHENTRATGGI
jgi:dTDP-4-dehydrorhamnose reductase